jgi:methyl-accepting chemotaxis protein
MSDAGKDFERWVESAYDLARAIRKGRKETSDVMIPIAFEEIRLSVEDLFEKIENQRALIQILIKAIDAMGKCNDAP